MLLFCILPDFARNLYSFVLGFDGSSADILAAERQLSHDLGQTSRRDSEFRSIFHHVQSAQLQRSPSELFAQHIVTIVHHIKGESGSQCPDIRVSLKKYWDFYMHLCMYVYVFNCNFPDLEALLH